MRLKFLCQCALRDLLYDRKVSFFVISSLVAVIAPLLLLFSLKFGIVSQLQQQLLKDPTNLEIKMLGVQSNRKLDMAWLTQLRQHPQVQFVEPVVNYLNTLADLRKDSSHFADSIELIPTEKGDPLIPHQAISLQKTQIILTALLAEKLNVNPGDNLTLFINRKLQGKDEKEKVNLQVVNILNESVYNRPAAFINLDLLINIENYRNGQPIDMPINNFAKARIYAKQLDDVAPLAKYLRTQGIETQTQATEIENVKAIDRVLSTLFLIIATTSMVGCVLSLSGSFLANIERKRKDISFLSLLGLTHLEIQGYLIIQAMILAGLAFIVALVFFGIASKIINFTLGVHLSSNYLVSHLLPSHILIAFTATILLSCAVAVWGGRQATHIQPSESLREI